MRILRFSMAFTLSLLSLYAYAKPELVITEASGAKSTKIDVDFVSDPKSEVSAFQFRMHVGGQKGKKVLENCAANLPKTHTGACSLKNGVLTYIVYSNSNAVLETTNVGSVEIPATLEKRLNNGSEVFDVVFSNSDGKKVEAEILRNYE